MGSSAEAVEYWPCPRDLHQWRWDDFHRYVGTSLRSFSTETYARATQMYQVPQARTPTTTAVTTMAAIEANSSARSDRPAEIYLKMVSDIKQICPINELVRRLRLDGELSKANVRVHRYIVEQRPSAPLAKQLAQMKRSILTQLNQQR